MGEDDDDGDSLWSGCCTREQEERGGSMTAEDLAAEDLDAEDDDEQEAELPLVISILFSI